MDEPIESQSLIIPIYTPKTKLDEYINCKANIDIYQTLKNLDSDEDSILEYFNNLYHEFDIILENLEKPIEIINRIQRLNLDKEDIFFLLQDLIIVITFSTEYSQKSYREQLNIILDLIVDAIFELGKELYPKIYGGRVEQNFRKIVSYSNSDEDNHAQIKKLINIKTGLQQNGILSGPDGKNEKLITIINLEINRIENLIKYSSENIKYTTNQNTGDLISGNILSDIESMELPKEPDLQVSELVNEIQSKENDKPKLKLKQIALIYIYQGSNITRENSNLIAKEHGYNSGEKLYQYFNMYFRVNDRKGAGDTKLKTKNKINLIESVIEFLPDNKKSKAIDEVSVLKSIYDELQ